MKSFLIIFSFFIRTGVFHCSQKSFKKSGYSNCSCSSIQNVCIFFTQKTAFFFLVFFLMLLFSIFNLDGLDMMLGFCFVLLILLLSCWFFQIFMRSFRSWCCGLAGLHSSRLELACRPTRYSVNVSGYVQSVSRVLVDRHHRWSCFHDSHHHSAHLHMMKLVLGGIYDLES